MYTKNSTKTIQEQKIKDLNNKKPSTFKNLYAKIRQNIKTSFPRSKQKNSLNIIKSKKITENASKKNNNYNMNLLFSKKPEESRNNKARKEAKIIYDNNQDEELYEYDDNNENLNFNKTQKNIYLFSKKNSKRNINKLRIEKNESKCDEHEMNHRSIHQVNYYSFKENNSSKDDLKINNNNVNKKIVHSKKIKSNIDLKKLVIGNNSDKKEFIENNDSKNKNNQKETKGSLDKKNKLFINRKITPKEEIVKNKNLNGKIQSARLVNYDSQKLNININHDVNNEIKFESNKNTFRMNSQKIVKTNNKEFENKTINEIKKAKKKKIIKQIKKQTSKNHSMNLNSNNDIILLNDTLKDNMHKSKKKSSIVNIYNYPIVIKNNKQNIPFDKEMIFDSADKTNQENSENTYINNCSRMDHTCINFNNNINMNNTLNNNNNRTIINTYEKKTPNSKHYSFIKPYSQEKISNLFYSKPVARLKKRIFNSPSDKDIQNSNNCIEVNDLDFRDKDSLEINNNKKENNDKNNYKELLIYIKMLNQIINTQKKIIKDYIENEIILKEEIEQKDKEINNYKNACLKLIYFLKEEKEINISNKINKKRNAIQSQLIRENNIFRSLLSSSLIKIHKNKSHRNGKNNLDVYSKSFCDLNIKEDDSSLNIYHLKKEKEQNNNKSDLIQIDNINIPTDIIDYSFNKKREKSYENKKRNMNRVNGYIYNNDNNNNNISNKLEENGSKSNKKICYLVKDKNIAFSFEKKIF